MTIPNPFFGSSVIVVSVILFYSAYRFYTNEQYKYALILIFAAGLLLRFYLGADFFLNSWDERYHALAAKNLLEHFLIPTLYDKPLFDYDYREWTNNHIWIHKPPLTLWLIAASLKLFGTHEIAVRIPSIILSSISILLTYSIGKYIFDRRTGLLASFFFAINGFLIELASGHEPTDHPDILFVFFVELGIFLSIQFIQYRKNIYLLFIGMAMGCAVLVKWLPAFIVVGIFFLILFQRDSWRVAFRYSFIVVCISCIIFVPWQIYIFSTFPKEAAWESYFNYMHIFEALDGHDGTFFYHFAMMPRIFGELIYLPLTLFIYMLAQKQISKNGAMLFVWIFVPYLFFSIVATKMPGYVMFSAPAVFIILAWSIWKIKESVSTKKWIRITLVLFLIILPIRYSIERLKPFQEIDRNPLWAQQFRNFSIMIGDQKAVIFNTPHYIEAMFYSHATAYPFIPSQDQLRHVKDSGYAVYIIGSPDVPQHIRNTQQTILLPYIK
ncbi:MAG: glycosyltransferase family 39 protein [Bacteroidota bacterium]|nr:glycosyltransferase family 39 protein [Bacteroidota bacterium]